MVLMKPAFQFSSHFSMAFCYVEDIYYIKYSLTFCSVGWLVLGFFACFFHFLFVMINTAEAQIQE